jgi:beta-phosphoglucomutase family hydrolase
MDGTLADTMPYHQQAWDSLLAELGLIVDKDEFFRWTAGLTNREIFPRLLDRALEDGEIEQLSERKEAVYRNLYQPHVAALPGAVRFLGDARRAGIALAVGTAAPPANIELVLDTLALRELLPVVVGAADVERGKPEPDIFLKAAARLGVDPVDCVVFEDAPAGIEAARRAGMRCVAVTTTLSRADIARLPRQEHLQLVVDDFRDPALQALLS